MIVPPPPPSPFSNERRRGANGIRLRRTDRAKGALTSSKVFRGFDAEEPLERSGLLLLASIILGGALTIWVPIIYVLIGLGVAGAVHSALPPQRANQSSFNKD